MARRHSQQRQFLLDGFSAYTGLKGSLAIIDRELAQIGGDAELADYQREMLKDLRDPLDEEALAAMHDYWNYDLEQLQTRGRGDWQGSPAKPRVEVHLEITSKDNFKAEWFPAGWGEYGRHAQTREDTDWLSWSRETSRSPGYFTRPSNELFFIHGVRPATYSVKTRERVTNRPSFQLDQVFLAACKGVVEKLKKRLQGCFDVRMLTDVFIEWESDRDRDST